MGGISLTVHPLFFAFGLYYAVTGKIFVFTVYTVTAVAHELGHSFAAASAGYKLNKITLMPFGAVVKGDIEGLKFSDEIKIALAGPILNLCVGLFFVALWWLFPEVYAFTSLAAEANFSMAAINLLPAFPLDGGRVLGAATSARFGRRTSRIICRVTGAILAAILVAVFVYSIFVAVNFSLLFFASFVLFGAFGKGGDNEYVRLYSAFSEKRLKNGLEVRTVAVDKKTTLKKVFSLMDENRLNQVDVYDGKDKIAHFSYKKLIELMEKGDLYQKIGNYLA